MRDLVIRSVLDRQLQKKFGQDPDTRIRHEFGVESGARRIDVATLNGHLTGWEIKSDEDTLDRLADQAESYGRVMDYLTLVTTSRYLTAGAELLPPWWGLMEAIEGRSGVRLVTRRSPRMNRSQDPFALARLLWRDEAMEELKLRGLSRGLNGKARWYLWEALVANTSRRELRQLVLHRLKQRQGWSGGQLRAQCDDSSHTNAIASPYPAQSPS